MVVVPTALPVTTPVKESTAATGGIVLIQVPPPEQLNVILLALQTVPEPVIMPGIGLTVTGCVA